MKIAAMTMVYRHYWALSRWYAHHAAQLGAENLFVLSHGPDPEIGRICPGARISVVPRDGFDYFDRMRAELMDRVHADLARDYDWVLRSDADELVCFDPEIWPSLPAALEAQRVPVVTALGFDLVEQPGDAALGAGTVFSQRRAVGFSGHYSKAVAARRAIPFHLHGVRVARRRLAGFPFHMPRGLYLAHLKYANTETLGRGNAIRMAVARGPGVGLPGAGWAEADADADAFYRRFAEKEDLSWEEAEAHAWRTLSIKPKRNERFSVVKTRALKLPYRTSLPARFSWQG
ncbi:glycosyltransferase family 2 protein [Sagittula salina]|uniref:Glycosyltransferase family 2 protein n=1 Tax=Sagittula salina TaxID=2820268 RepID=A0A940RZJ2_9RHOB|nr:glycosyltransferase family 2 protein [Sagittula salina]MBP0482043.1 glycosyltransferase family 2 protein [Sagittula salina]